MQRIGFLAGGEQGGSGPFVAASLSVDAPNRCENQELGLLTGLVDDLSGLETGTLLVDRGCGWRCQASFATSVNRAVSKPVERYLILGFRVALDPPAKIEPAKEVK